MKYLPKETCEYLVSLGCKSESGVYWVPGHKPRGQDRLWFLQLEGAQDENNPGGYDECSHFEHRKTDIPAFSLEDILRKDNAEKIWMNTTEYPMSLLVLREFRHHPDTWPEEVAKLIKPLP